jgi:hypothetical protein
MLPVTAVVVAPDGIWLANASDHWTVQIWDPATRRQRTALTGHTGPATAIAIAPDGMARHHQRRLDAADLGPDGVTMTTGTYIPTEVCDQGIADNLGIPAAYLRRPREHKPGLYDANVNAWLDGDDCRFLLRCLRPASVDGPGAARAFLSEGYKIIDNLDVLLAVLDGVRQASAPVQVDGCDLTERRMYVR